MKNDFLGNLLGSPSRAKILRLFVFNQDECYTSEQIAKKAQVTKTAVQKELKSIEKTGLIKKKQCTQEVSQGRGKNKTIKKKKVPGWGAEGRSPYLPALLVFLRSVAPTSNDGVSGKLKAVGRLRLVVLAGRLCDDENSRIDLLVVGDSINDKKLQVALRSIEADLGSEVSYAAFSTDEFKYRLNIYDKLVRDVFDYSHEILLDSLDVHSILAK